MAKNTLETKRTTPFPSYIIGIGASAGGLEAIHDLFDYMPANTGFSFVVVQHLSPDHKSLMAELLSKHTAMNVREAGHNMKLEPDCIYVIPAKKLITVKGGRLQLDEKAKSRLPNYTIDIFFESLAQDQKSKAVGIILSGTGTDGTKGLAAIKKNGGVAIVQDPLTAAFDGMPNSAVDAGVADIILPPEMIGEELIEYLKDESQGMSLRSFSEEDEGILRDILNMLNRSTRHDFNHYKRPTLFRRLTKRMAELGIKSMHRYKEYVGEHDDELKILSREFLINVTKFFRDAEAFEVLRAEVLPSILGNKKADDTIKVWVVACSTGEEAYSLGMLFLEYFEKHKKPVPNIKIFATDIDAEALEIASRGVYPSSIERDVEVSFIRNYFVQEGSYYRVTPELRKLVVFANHDVVQDPPFSRLELISCRNMFIYMNSDLQRKALRKFHFALSINGYLMLGPSENIGVLRDVTQEVNRKWKIYRCTSKQLPDGNTVFSPLEGTIFPKDVSRKTSISLPEILKDTLLEDRRIALIIIDRDFNVKQAIGSYKAFLQFPDDSFNFNLLKLAKSDLSIAIGVSVRKSMVENDKVVARNVVLHGNEENRVVNIIVKPYLNRPDAPHPFISILIEEVQAETRSYRAALNPDSNKQMLELEKELTETRENLQAVIEEMETVNEELQASNEEMVSTNEELQSTNEELQSLNEELHTVSVEHQMKIKELFELNDDLNNYFNNTDIGQILVDGNIIIRKFTPSSKQMINLIESDVGRPLKDITTNLKDINLFKEVEKVISEQKATEREVDSASGKYFLMRINPYMRRDKTVEGAVINFLDISHSKNLTSIIQGIFESSNNGIAAKRAVRNSKKAIVDFEYVVVNRAAEQMFHVPHNSLEGKRFLEVVNDDRRHHFKTFVEVVNTGVAQQVAFYDEISDKWYETNVVKMLDGVVTMHIDITEKKKNADVIAKSYSELKMATAQLRESNSQLERSNFDLMQFASVASHDLKEPLRKIQAFGNILQSKIVGKLTESEVGYLSKMISASHRMQTLIDDVLTLSKLSNSNSVKEKINLNTLVRQIREDLEILIFEKKATIKVGSLPTVKAVPGQIHQVFQNLISNALKFNNKKKPVVTIEEKSLSSRKARVFGLQDGRYVYILVKDNGIGFENEYREKIFGIFQRLHGRNYEGTGIGLAIARKIIENHGGQIFATGDVNKGAQFHILLPAEDVTPQVKRRSRTKAVV